MAKQKRESKSWLVSLVVWLTGVLVSLSVGLGMAGKTLNATMFKIPIVVTQVAGWIVVVLTLVSVIAAIVDRL